MSDTETLLEVTYGVEAHLREAANELFSAREDITIHTHLMTGETLDRWYVALIIFADMFAEMSRRLEADDE